MNKKQKAELEYLWEILHKYYRLRGYEPIKAVEIVDKSRAVFATEKEKSCVESPNV